MLSRGQCCEVSEETQGIYAISFYRCNQLKSKLPSNIWASSEEVWRCGGVSYDAVPQSTFVCGLEFTTNHTTLLHQHNLRLSVCEYHFRVFAHIHDCFWKLQRGRHSCCAWNIREALVEARSNSTNGAHRPDGLIQYLAHLAPIENSLRIQTPQWRQQQPSRSSKTLPRTWSPLSSPSLTRSLYDGSL